MKITKEQKNILLKRRKRWVNEGIFGNIVGRLYAWAVKRELSKDKGFMQSLKDADETLEKLRKNVKIAKEKGYKLPPRFDKYL